MSEGYRPHEHSNFPSGPRCTEVADKLVQLFGWRQTYKVEKRQRSLVDSLARTYRQTLQRTSSDGDNNNVRKKCTRICVEGELKTVGVGGTTLIIPDRDLNLDLPVIGDLVYSERNLLDYAATVEVNSVNSVLSSYMGIVTSSVIVSCLMICSDRVVPAFFANFVAQNVPYTHISEG
uniref:Uncharacterized protein n=1 Tax=Timema monikensis TaxID=170555 RepID=A0A7R9E7D6_9NEOP|nr:unnamed protein product [Timema monikensis]